MTETGVDFDDSTLAELAEGDELTSKVFSVIRKLAITSEASDWQLGLIWLDGKGWGGLSLLQLFERIEEFR